MSESGSTEKRSNEPIRSENPRRVRNGMKIRAREQITAENWVAQRWHRLLNNMFQEDALVDGFTYARAGQIITMEVQSGRITAKVQGRALKPYVLEWRLTPMTQQQWETVIVAMAGGAIYAARLLAGDLPSNLESLFAEHELELIPGSHENLECSCSCAEDKPCKHLAAVALLVTERLNDDPLLSFLLYGLPASQVLDRLRQARAIHTHGVASAHADPLIPESQIDPLPLETCIDEFWRCGPQLMELEHAPPPQHIAHALLRRLGPSPMQGRFPLVGLLASIYDTVSDHAIRIRDQAEHIDEDATEGAGS